MNYTPVYQRTAEAIGKTARFVSSCGGTRSGKTYSNLQLLYGLALMDRVPTITSVVSETFPHLKRGAIRDFRAALGDLWDEGKWSKAGSTYTLDNGSLIEFFSADAPAKVHGPARDRLFLNEAQNIPYEIARQLFVRTRGLVLIDYNPTHSFWANERIEPRDNCVTVHSTYLDNPFLTPEQIAEIEANRDDRNWWQVYGEGKVGTLDGLVYPSFTLIDKLPDPDPMEHLEEIQGLDFGFTNDPTARVRLVVDSRRRVVYAQQRDYATRMQNRHIIESLVADGVPRSVPIYADCAEPKSIADIAEAGFNVFPADKDAPVNSDKLTFQLNWMQRWALHVTKDSVDLIRELREYTWQKDRDGKPINRPIDKFNHALDALRYALWSHFGANAGQGVYAVSKIRRNDDKRRYHH